MLHTLIVFLHLRDLTEFPRLLCLGLELLFVSCDDGEADVRLVAGECINRITKASICFTL